MAKSRASKGFLLDPVETPNVSGAKREKWLSDAVQRFVHPSQANREIYKILLEAFWPEGHGIPGPILSQNAVRTVVDEARASKGKPPYKDVFRRLRELQGEEGFVGIVKEGSRYQLQNLEVAPKREPRAKLDPKTWDRIKEGYGHKCAHCGAQEPDVQLSPDHKVPRARGGGNEEDNWQPLCEQCNNLKSSSCQGCSLNCYVCSWSFPETYKPIYIDDENKERIRRLAEKRATYQSELVNRILRDYFNKAR